MMDVKYVYIQRGRVMDNVNLTRGALYSFPGLFLRPDDANLYTTLEQPTLSSNPNVFFQRGGNVHPGMMY